jgi:hypothetical protein
MRTTLILMLTLSVLAAEGYGQDTLRSFQVRFTPGIDFAHLTISNSPEYRHANIRIGGEIEFLLPSEKRKWGLFAEPAYQSFSQQSVGFRYESIEASIGIRYRLFLENKSYFFVNVISLLDIPLAHSQRYSLGIVGNVTLKDDSFDAGFAGGAGFSFRRLSLEGRFYSERVREGSQLPLHYYYRKTSLILGFRLF